MDEQGQGPTSIVLHCSSSSPGPCPSTRHSQCNQTIRLNTQGLFTVDVSGVLICPRNAAFTRPDNDTTDTNKMSCMELCGSVHTIQRQIPAQIPIDSIPILSVSVSVSASTSVSMQYKHLQTILYNLFFICLCIGVDVGQCELNH